MSILQMSFSGAVMILVIMLVRALAIHKLPKRAFLLLWDVVLLRLLLPFSIPSGFSAYSLVRPAGMISDTVVENVVPQTESGQLFRPSGVGGAAAAGSQALSVWRVVWLVGMLVCFVLFLAAYVRLYLEFRTSFPVEQPFVTEWLKEHGRRCVRVRQSDRIAAPLSYGIFRPVILMPKCTDWSDEKNLQYVLLHEYVHICRYDILRKLIAALALCVHWFNPMVYAMYALFNRDVELACDERVVRQLGESSRAAYARALIAMAEREAFPAPLCNGFGKNAIEERIVAIMRTKKTGILAFVLSAMVLAVIIVPFATSAQKPLTSDENLSDGDRWNVAALVTDYTGDAITLDVVEYVTDDDVERKNDLIEELHLEEGSDLSDGLFLDGYYIYNPDSATESYRITDETVFHFIDWGCDFTGSDSPEEYTTTDWNVFQEYLKTYDPMPGMPFFFAIEDGVVKSVVEKPMA